METPGAPARDLVIMIQHDAAAVSPVFIRWLHDDRLFTDFDNSVVERRGVVADRALPENLSNFERARHDQKMEPGIRKLKQVYTIWYT